MYRFRILRSKDLKKNHRRSCRKSSQPSARFWKMTDQAESVSKSSWKKEFIYIFFLCWCYWFIFIHFSLSISWLYSQNSPYFSIFGNSSQAIISALIFSIFTFFTFILFGFIVQFFFKIFKKNKPDYYLIFFVFLIGADIIQYFLSIQTPSNYFSIAYRGDDIRIDGVLTEHGFWSATYDLLSQLCTCIVLVVFIWLAKRKSNSDG